MAAAAHFSARVYGEVQGTPPFQNGSGQASFTLEKPWPTSAIVSFPTDGTTFYPLTNGVSVGGSYVYSVIVLPPTGLNVHGTKYVTDSSVATLATLAG